MADTQQDQAIYRDEDEDQQPQFDMVTPEMVINERDPTQQQALLAQLNQQQQMQLLHQQQQIAVQQQAAQQDKIARQKSSVKKSRPSKPKYESNRGANSYRRNLSNAHSIISHAQMAASGQNKLFYPGQLKPKSKKSTEAKAREIKTEFGPSFIAQSQRTGETSLRKGSEAQSPNSGILRGLSSGASLLSRGGRGGIPRSGGRKMLQSADPRIRRPKRNLYGRATMKNGAAMSGQVIGGAPKYGQSGTGMTVVDKQNLERRAMSFTEADSAVDNKNVMDENAVKSENHLEQLTTMDIQNLDVVKDPKKEFFQANHLMRTVGESETQLVMQHQEQLNSENIVDMMRNQHNYLTIDDKPQKQLHPMIPRQVRNRPNSNNFHQKRKSHALPSTYVRSEIRTDGQRTPNLSRSPSHQRSTGQTSAAEVYTRCPTGPADYSKQALVGNRKIMNSQIRAEPTAFFTTAQTHRTETMSNYRAMQSAYNSRQGSKPRLIERSNLNSRRECPVSVETSKGAPAVGKPNEALMLFYKASTGPTPGVTDYNSREAKQKLLKSTPKACIGRAARFGKSYNKEFVRTTAHQYVTRHSLVFKKPAKMGCIGNAVRFKPKFVGSTGPGVGDYDLTHLRSLAKAKESSFQMPDSGLRYVSKVRARSAMPTRRDSRTPNKRKVGGPVTPVKNFMMQASRDQRKKLFISECQDEGKNASGPGPAAHSEQHVKEYIHGHKFAATIGKAQRDLSADSLEHKTPISHSTIEQINKVKTRRGSSATIGKSRQKFNVGQMGATYGNLWSKGFYFY